MIHYYFTVYPMEALIASELTPENFGSYMATGEKQVSSEELIFIELTGETGDFFDWDFAEKKCVSHTDGSPKHSLYLGVYRILENIPLEAMGNLFLVTKDGRILEIEKSEYHNPDEWRGYAMYKELCPVNPLVVSALDPKKFAEFIVSDSNKVTAPAIVFSDINVGNIEDKEHTGNVGSMFSHLRGHIINCIQDLRAGKGKLTKVVSRSVSDGFSYQVIGEGIYVGKKNGIVMYPMPDRKTLKKENYDWGKSALIF